MTVEAYREQDSNTDWIWRLGWQRSPAEDRTAPDAGSAEQLRGEIKSVVPLWAFTGGRLAKPVRVWVWKGEDMFFAENPNLHIYATGDTLEEAVDQFRELFAQQSEHFRRVSWDRVTGDAVRLKRLFMDLCEPTA